MACPYPDPKDRFAEFDALPERLRGLSWKGTPLRPFPSFSRF